jgi:Protein of unknown function (DUF3800)
MLYRVYVDEAGDRGTAGRSSAHFVVSAVIVDDGADAQVRAELADLRKALGRGAGKALHFQKLTHSQRLKAAQDLAEFSIAKVTNVIITKREFTATSGMLKPFIAQADPMYLWALRLLLERVSWYVRGHGDGEAIVTFAHIRRFKTRKLHEYREALKRHDTRIHWPAFDAHPFRIDQPGRIELLQLADTAASALFRAVEPDDFDNREPRYLKELQPVLYRGYPGNVVSYGLKVFPTEAAAAVGRSTGYATTNRAGCNRVAIAKSVPNIENAKARDFAGAFSMGRGGIEPPPYGL